MRYKGENKKFYFILLVGLLFLGCENSTKDKNNNINEGNTDINHLEENSSFIESNVTETNTSETLSQIEVFDINNSISKEISVGKVSIPFKRNDSVERVELMGNDSKKFKISLDGTIYTKEQLVAISQKLIKKERVYDFKVKITYRSRKIVYINIRIVAYEHIAVEDIEDAPPIPTSPIIVNRNTAPIFISPTTISVNENQIDAITLSATDSNGDTLTYSINEGDSSSFNIDSSTGVVTFKVEADYEIKQIYSFTASVSDGIEVATQTITITIIPALIKNSILKNGYTIKETTRESYVIKDFSSYIGNTTIEEESKLGYITLSDYGAVGDGINDDTASLKEALNESRVQNKPLYIPNGIYKITETISLQSGDSILGADKAVIYADNRPENAYFIDMKGTSANPIENVTIENIIFYKVAINLYITNNIQIKNNTFLDIIENNPKHADYHTALTVGSVSKNITIDGNEFLNTVDNRVVREISLYNTQNVIITNNHFGIQKNKQFTLITDFNNLKTGIGLISKNVDTTIEYNRIVGSTYSPQDGDGYTHKDHAIYFKKYDNVLFKYNMVGGWPTDASGGLKLRNTTGKGEFSNNELYNIGFITYIYPTTEPRAFINQTFKDNTFFVSETPTKSLIFYWGPTWEQINTDPNGKDAVTEENAMAKDITISSTNIYYNENFNQSSIIHTRFNICSSDSCNYTNGAIREGNISNATYQSQEF